MADFNSKYTGEEVEQLLDQVAKGETLTETDIANMGFTKNQGTITEVKMNGVSKGTSGVVDLGDVQTPISDLETIREGASKGATAIQPSTLASVATSGSYNDLADKPTIPNYDSILDMGFLTEENVAEVATSGSYNHLSDKPDIPTEATVSGWGFTKNTGTYSKPSGGIPKTDLTSDVQSALGKAESAVQRDKYGDMDSIQTHGFEGSLSGKLYALPDESTGDEDETLLSTHNVKTINGQSIFGKGNISIEGGGSGSSGGGKEYVVVEPDISPSGAEILIYSIEPNKTYIISEPISILHINGFGSTEALCDEYNVIFKADMGGTTLTIVDVGYIFWANGTIPTMEGGAIYELSIQRVRISGYDMYNVVVTPFKIIE